MNEERVPMGIVGLDEMLSGGLIPGSICAIIGTYGTGKTAFSLQFVWEGLKNGESIIYISLEEREERILRYMEQKGWDVAPFINKTFFVIKLDPTDFNISNNRIKNELPEMIKQTGATRVVIDPISLFEDLFPSDGERRHEMFRFFDGIRDKNCTFVITSEAHMEYPFLSRHNLVEYFADTVIVLRYIRPSDLTEVHLALEVVKMRLSQHSREIKPYDIQPDQIVVHSEANVF
jgi:KaiC domain protein